MYLLHIPTLQFKKKNNSKIIVKGKFTGKNGEPFKISNNENNHLYQNYNFEISEVLKGDITNKVIKIRNYADVENSYIEGKFDVNENSEYILTLYVNKNLDENKNAVSFYDPYFEINGVFERRNSKFNTSAEFINKLGLKYE